MTDRSRLIPLLERLREVKILVVGDAMLDRFVTGTVDRISPEAPIPILHVKDETAMPGGAGNVVRNLSAAGAKSIFIGVSGAGPSGRELEKHLSALDGADVRLVKDPNRPTTIKVRYVSGTQQLMRADWEDKTSLSDAVADGLLNAVDAALGDCQAVILSDYDKGVLDDGRAATIIAKAKDAGIPVIVDPKGDDFSRYAGADLITPNRKEIHAASRMDADTNADVEAAAQELITAHDFANVLVTRSADGMTLVGRKGDPTHLAAETREVFDVSGAGDTVVALMAALMASGAPLSDAAKIANTAAGIVVGKVGTASAYATEIIAALHHEDISSAESKILTVSEASDKIAAWRRQSLSVGFTNGCFDLLHPGHVSLLSQARAACDRLIVGLNSDASVKRLKGETRPVQNEAARAAVLASLASVDMVVVFAEDTPLSLITALRPDVLVKGADYSVEQVVGASEVGSWGGRVVLADLKPGHSTTATIAKLGSDPE
jgi:D-beta-D-heptose 7-phosphate kinase/D-beta-D-heptose 1-phosphate adenosyltransferase